ncbi:MAG: hypothetical protein A2Z18_02650 [Armatimonadetes bacterium RBG_16_58_9]|nr:MAG: hypothetical protein A2Z18_02650 [Armatimonadetes bacterium RBG_16_58_9]
MDLAMQVVTDAFESEGWPEGLWTEFYNELTCEKDARDASSSEKIADNLTIELHRYATPSAREMLKSVALESRVKVARMLQVEFARPVIVTVFLPDAAVDFISGSHGYVAHKTGLDKICIPHSNLRSQSELESTLVHEFTHVAARELAGDRLPSWLNEGLATYLCGDLSSVPRRDIDATASRYPELVRTSHLEGALISVDMRKDDPDRVDAAYFLAASFLEHWVSRHGLESVRETLVQIGRGRGVARAVGQATGAPPRALERDWRRYLLGPNR